MVRKAVIWFVLFVPASASAWLAKDTPADSADAAAAAAEALASDAFVVAVDAEDDAVAALAALLVALVAAALALAAAALASDETPATCVSVYAFVAASCALVGLATFTILLFVASQLLLESLLMTYVLTSLASWAR